GAKGIGPKSAIQLIEQFGRVEDIIARRAEISGKRAREAVETCEADILMSKRLVTIMDDLDVELDLDALRAEGPDLERLFAVYDRLEFEALKKPYRAAAPKAPEYVQVSLFG